MTQNAAYRRLAAAILRLDVATLAEDLRTLSPQSQRAQRPSITQCPSGSPPLSSSRRPSRQWPSTSSGALHAATCQAVRI
jgi:hypothetical protein